MILISFQHDSDIKSISYQNYMCRNGLHVCMKYSRYDVKPKSVNIRKGTRYLLF